MRALAVIPGHAESASVRDVPEPVLHDGQVLVETLSIGLCGTDTELLHRSPSETEPLVIGHEVVARVIEAPSRTLRAGDLVFGVIREPCAQPCTGCHIGRVDLCESRPLRERGIYSRDGFGSERWVSNPEQLIAFPPNTKPSTAIFAEPLTSVLKAHDRYRIAATAQAIFAPRRLLILGAGTIGLLASWIVGKEFTETHIIDPALDNAHRIALSHLPGVIAHDRWEGIMPDSFDLVVEASGAPDGLGLAIRHLRQAGVVVHLGIPPVTCTTSTVMHDAVLKDAVIIGSVNASRAHHVQAAALVNDAPPGLLDAMITKMLTVEEWPAWAHHDRRSPIKTTVMFSP